MAVAENPPPTPATSATPYPVNLLVEYPEHLSRWLILVKWLLVIPHGIVMMFLAFGQYTALFFAWWAILFTGRYPRGLFNFVVAVQAWSIRVNAYAAFLVTDAYPPFEFDRPVNTGLAVGMIFLGSALLVAFFVVVPAIALAAAMSGSGGGLVY